MAFAATPSDLNSDVALRPGGVLVGQVVDQQGVAQANAPISIQYGNYEVVRTTTDKNGVFAAKGLRGGEYRLLTSQGGTSCRLWAADTAPPAAKPAALIVAGQNVVRGMPGSGMIGWVKAHPYITAAAVGTAIAVPLALADDDADNE
jgi:hypothetical protein